MTATVIKPAYADKLPPHQFSCGHCGKTFGTKAAKRKHKQACGSCGSSGAPDFSEERVADEDKFGRIPADVRRPYVIALADAEWRAMDDRGRLPDWWTFPSEEQWLREHLARVS